MVALRAQAAGAVSWVLVLVRRAAGRKLVVPESCDTSAARRHGTQPGAKLFFVPFACRLRAATTEAGGRGARTLVAHLVVRIRLTVALGNSTTVARGTSS